MAKLFCCGKKQPSRRTLTKLKEEKEEECNINLSWPWEETREALSQSPFVNIANEIIINVFQFLSVPDLDNVSLLYDNPVRAVRRPCKKRYEGPVEFIGTLCQCDTKALEIRLSVDINTTAPHLILLLKKASCFQQQWEQLHILKQMIARYYRFMQLKASNKSDTLLIPTLDIEIVWQTHLLRPKMYRNDCIRLFGFVIDHSLLHNDYNHASTNKAQAFLDTYKLYEQRFGKHYCSLSSCRKRNPVGCGNDHISSLRCDNEVYSYWDESFYEFLPKPPKDYKNPFSFTTDDILSDWKWLYLCKQYISRANKLSMGKEGFVHYPTYISLEPEVLEPLMKSYERFLYIAAKHPMKNKNGVIPPTPAIDIIWRTHMQQPLEYVADCRRLVGYVIYHNPWPIIGDKIMKKSCDQINQIWKDEFRRDIETDHVRGTDACRRGQEPTINMNECL
ncbi:unnamed protein product [Adineta steineri]|uniref:F-box domain-containing protein n=1 Tax=Adineta steineri TaxID=433720 RepID=A0A818RZY8_9BILA|nr:unnamed protein product [Adineta steineri]